MAEEISFQVEIPSYNTPQMLPAPAPEPERSGGGGAGAGGHKTAALHPTSCRRYAVA